jgi:hypothetical protein
MPRRRNSRKAENVSSNEEFFNASANPSVNYPNSPMSVLKKRLNALTPISTNSRMSDLERRLRNLTNSPPHVLRDESSNPYLEENMVDLEKRLERLQGPRGTVVGRRVYSDRSASSMFNGLNVPAENVDEFRDEWRRIIGIKNTNMAAVRHFNEVYKEQERKFLSNQAANDEKRERRPFNYHRRPFTPYMLRMRKLDIKYPKSKTAKRRK